MKKKVYIISHSHLDREWYMPFEQHHMRVVELFDELLDSFENDPTFRYFHLDGQTIPLDDYLEVKPENRAKVEKFIREGKLKIGPFYILQDDFLISSEANVRNMLVGMKESQKYGTPVKLGYFPDTFGNMGQTPQLMKKAGLDSAAFGRGVKPTGFNNSIGEDYSSQYSEMWWKGSDQTEIFGLLFANWYSNGNEIPNEKEAALAFWKQKLADAEKYASTNHLLMMNGVDHQPLQKDVGQAIALANELFPDYEFIHSNFDEYLTAVKADLPENLGTVTGELTSQETPGWYTLANTASARIYLKQENVRTQMALENKAEPLSVMASQVSGSYPQDELEYAWKLLMQNHPHDSICGCSVDEVHREMMTRFAKSREVAKFIQEEALETLAKEINTSDFSETSYPFTIYNTSGVTKTEVAQVKIELERVLFEGVYPEEAYHKLEESATPQMRIVDSYGKEISFIVDNISVEFNYDLPKDAFRVPYMAKYAYLTVYVENLAPLSWKTYALELEEGKTTHTSSMIKERGQVLENAFVKAEITNNGSLTITDKKNKKIYPNSLVFEDVGDVGNEYVFKESIDKRKIYSTSAPFEVEVIKDTEFMASVKLTHHLELPVSCDEQLLLEQQMVRDIRGRKAKRSTETSSFELSTIITLKKDSSRLSFVSSFNNTQKDHRLRVLFPTNLKTEIHQAESIFEVVERSNNVSDVWENPTNPQHQQAFVNINDGKFGVTVGNIGLNEYEVLPETETIAVTLLRSVGEMGDWGYFPTPEAQCLGGNSVYYSFEAHGIEDYFESLKQARGAQIELISKQTKIHDGKLDTEHSFVSWENDTFALTALKQSEENTGIILRGYNLENQKTSPMNVKLGEKAAHVVDLLEKNGEEFSNELTPAEILTLKFT
ncbi:MAG: alpha-mannosidase [Lactobacillales bacterium]|jgi:alpha-mannosidase|nr:alpha-mannosidase [Lactobacillales bacterium]